MLPLACVTYAGQHLFLQLVNMHSCPVTHLVYACFQINMFPQTPLYLFLQLTTEQLVDILRNEADEEEFVYCHCQS